VVGLDIVKTVLVVVNQWNNREEMGCVKGKLCCCNVEFIYLLFLYLQCHALHYTKLDPGPRLLSSVPKASLTQSSSHCVVGVHTKIIRL
jgi:hypothetical protein